MCADIEDLRALERTDFEVEVEAEDMSMSMSPPYESVRVRAHEQRSRTVDKKISSEYIHHPSSVCFDQNR